MAKKPEAKKARAKKLETELMKMSEPGLIISDKTMTTIIKAIVAIVLITIFIYIDYLNDISLLFLKMTLNLLGSHFPK